MIRQLVFRCGHPKLQIRPTLMIILECASPVCIRCMVLEIQLFFVLLWGNSSRHHFLKCMNQSSVSDTLQHPRQLRQQILGVQQQGLVSSRWFKNLAARCFKEGTGYDIRKYMIRSRLSNVSYSHVKLL